VQKPEVPLLLAALARITVANYAELHKYSATTKRRWIIEAQDINDIMRNDPRCDRKNVEFVEGQLESSAKRVEAEIARADEEVAEVAEVADVGKDDGIVQSGAAEDQGGLRAQAELPTRGTKVDAEEEHSSSSDAEDATQFVDATEEVQSSPESSGSRMSGAQPTTIAQFTYAGEETDTESVAGKGLLPAIPLHLKKKPSSYLPTPVPSSDPADSASGNGDVEMGGVNGSQGGGKDRKGSNESEIL
jgi:hypothetical protein